MVDIVAYHIEWMLLELEDLEKHKLFDKKDLKETMRQ